MSLAEENEAVVHTLAGAMATEQAAAANVADALRRETASNDRLRRTLAAICSLNSTRTTVDELLQHVVDMLLGLTAATSAVVEWIDGDQLCYRAASGTARQHIGLTLPIVGTLSGECIRLLTPLMSSDTDIDSRVDKAACRNVRVASAVVAPVISEGAPIATLKLLSDRRGTFANDDIDILRCFASCVESQLAAITEDGASGSHAQTDTRIDVVTDASTVALRGPQQIENPHAILDNAHDAFICIDAQGIVTDWNKAAESTFGWRKAGAVGHPLATLIIPERHREAHRAGMNRYLSTGKAHVLNRRLELPALRRSGEEFPVEMTITTATVDGHLQFACFLRDITERCRAAEADERLRLLVQSVRDYAIFLLDPDGTIATWNNGARAIMQYEQEEILGRNVSTLFTPADVARGKAERELETATREGRAEEEGWRLRKDGSVFWGSMVITALKDEKGSLRGFAKVIRDMTQRRRLEALEASSRRMNEFLALLGHELRNPLAPIRNAVSLLKAKASEDLDVIRSRNIVDRQLAHLTRLVDDLLDAGRATTGKISLLARRVEVADIVQLGVEGSQPSFDAQKQTLACCCPRGLYVNGDATRLVQVLQNLLNNASKFSGRGDTIQLDVGERGSAVAIIVKDRGRGISASALQSIFELFVQEQEPGASPDEGGLGIGLTLARAIVELHGGHIEAFSEGRGTGSTFTVWLPKACDEQRAQPAPVSSGPPQRKQLRILVVDDNRDSADSMAMLLETLGHEALAVYDGPRAIELAAQFEPHSVLLDLSMPDMDGFETLRRLRADVPRRMVIAAMTGLSSDEAKLRIAAAGFDAHLMKPVELETIHGILEATSPRY
ncbi:MAG: PAS domain S-box protein [Janthinobacterium lividum]